MTAIEEFIQFVTERFLYYYQKEIMQTTSHFEHASLLADGYCFYYACFIQEFFKDCSLYLGNYHYILKYQENFYDYRGQIKTTHSFIFIYPFDCMEIEKLILVKDIEMEKDMQDILGYYDRFKEQNWQKIYPFLKKDAQNFLEQISLQRKKSL